MQLQYNSKLARMILLRKPVRDQALAPRRVTIRAVSIVLLLWCSLCWAQERPRVGLALSGGGAKGIAHIGVLKVLEEANVPIDYISGTSMGAIIGGLYAIGYRADELEKIFREINWVDLLADKVDRRSLGVEQKFWDGRYITSLPIRNNRIRLPSGLSAGQQISRLLSRLTLPVHNERDFERFPIPFVCVATNIVTGEPVVLRTGFLAEAMRASMSLPSIFTPIRIGGKLLVDGGLVRNLPVEDVQALGADLVIAVDASSPLHDEQALQSLVNVLDQAVNFMVKSTVMHQRELSDVLIVPEIGDYTISDFFALDSLITKGAEAARKSLLQIMDLIKPQLYDGYVRPPAKMPSPDSVRINGISIRGLENISEEVVRAGIRLDLPASLSVAEVAKVADRVYSSQLFERVTYQIEANPQGGTLILSVVEKQDDSFRLGFRYDSHSEASVLLATNFRNVLNPNSFLNFDLRLGNEISAELHYFLHTGLGGLGIRTRARFSDEFIDVFDGHQKVVQLNAQSTFFETLVGHSFATSASSSFGLRYEFVDVSPQIALRDTLSYSSHLLPLINVNIIDTYDRAYFPRGGFFLLFRNEIAFQTFGSDLSFSQHYLDMRSAVPISRRISLFGEVLLGLSTGDEIPFHKRFMLGGLDTPASLLNRRLTKVSFVGFKSQELIGNQAQFFQIGIQYELWYNLFMITRVNAVNLSDTFQVDLSPERFTAGAGVTIGALTPIGPVEFTVMTSGRHNLLPFLNIGFKF